MRIEIEKVETERVRRIPLLTELRVSPSRTEEPIISPPISVETFTQAVMSWNCRGVWRFELRVLIGTEWSPWCVMGEVNGNEQSSVKSPAVGDISVAMDTLLINNGKRAQAFQVQATGSGDVTALAVTHYQPEDRQRSDAPSRAWGMTLPVPERSQGVEAPPIRSLVCSPTSIGMVLEYYGRQYTTAELARAVWDTGGRIYGNWPLNTAVAARLLDGWAAVAKLRSFAELEPEIAARRPVVLSHRWGPGELTNAPISRSPGHLIVVVGFTEKGDVVVNDPAAKPGSVRRVYKRAELFNTWQQRGSGIVYLIHPRT